MPENEPVQNGRRATHRWDGGGAGRTLTDADVEAIVDRFQDVVTKQFYTDIGKGVIAACKRVLIVLLIAFAAYGSWKGIK